MGGRSRAATRQGTSRGSEPGPPRCLRREPGRTDRVCLCCSRRSLAPFEALRHHSSPSELTASAVTQLLILKSATHQTSSDEDEVYKGTG